MTMDKEIQVRKATAEDIPALIGLMREFYAEANFKLDDQWATEAFMSLLSNDSYGCAWIVSTADIAMGHAVLTVRFTMEHGGMSGYVDDLFVRKEFRKHGAGFSLLQELERECSIRNCKSLIVEVGKDNDAGLRTYQKLGMHQIDDGRILYRKPLP